MRPSLPALVAARSLVAALAFLVPAPLSAQARPAPDSSLRAGARALADTDTVRRPLVIPGLDLPFQVDLRLESNWNRFRNLRCTSAELFQASTQSACDGRFAGPNFLSTFSFRAAGTVKDRVHVNVDYDQQREFESSQVLSAYYEAPEGSRLQRVELGNINFVAPQSRFITSSLPAGNYGLQVTNQFGRVKLRSIFAAQTGNVVQNKLFTVGGHAQQVNDREISDFEIERLRFFFTVDPALFGRAYPNVDILNRAQLDRLRATLPDSLRPTRVFLYRLQFGGQPQDPNGPRFRVQGDPGQGRQTYDVLREGVDYYMDKSMLWFALVRPLNEANERLVVAYNVRINGRDTIWTTTGGTPDIKAIPGRDQVANLIIDPAVGPSAPAFRNEIRSVYRVAGENLVRETTKIRVVTGSGLLEHPLAGSDATFLQMLGIAQPTNPADFDYENRLWPRRSDAVFNLGVGAADVRNGQSLDAAQIIRDYFLVFPSARPFSPRDSGLVSTGNPTNDAIYTIPGEYLYSAQHPASVYRLHFTFETVGTESFGTLALGSSQMRPSSERILVDGRPLVRGLDYRMNYDIGQVEFMRPDTLFRLRRRVEASYEENPVFAASTTRLAGVVSELPVSHGLFTFTAISQSQSSAQELTRPQLGFQGASTLTAGATGTFSWDAPALTRLANRLSFGRSTTPSRVSLITEVASSRPQFAAGNSNTAYLETFDTDGGITIPLGDQAWNYSSMPAYGNTLRSQFPGTLFEPARASTLVWQTVPKTPGGAAITFTRSSIDPLLRFTGSGIETTEPVLWLSLLPLDLGGDFQPGTRRYNWTSGTTTSGRRWRSIRTVLSPAGIDLTANEHLEFWALIDTSSIQRGKNPALVFDFGDVSENALAFAPETLTVRHNANGTVDSLFTGKKLQGFDRLDSERDPFSHAFNADANDTGLPGDVVDTLVVIDGASVTRLTNVRICSATPSATLYLGDQNANCTVGNHRLDEEDIDLDGALNFSNARRESERVLRYVVDLSDPAKYKRVGGSYTDTVFVSGQPIARSRQWVLVSVPFKAPTDSLNDVNRRRIRALRLTVVSGALQGAEEPTQFPIAELRVTGAPWLNRSTQTLAGLGAIRPDGGFVVLSTIGTNDSSAAVVYQPPPGVGDQPDSRLAAFAGTRTAINESAMRIQAGNLPLFHRAEAYNRFPAGPQYFMGYQELRVWARGRGDGWGLNGDLQMYMKVGRDENNFYMRRTPANAGATQAAWTDVPVDFGKFKALRTRIQQDYIAGKKESIACTGLDSALVAATPLPVGVIAHKFAACDDGYIAYTIDPAVSAPNLAAVQEMAVGIVRVASAGGGSPILPGDTLELWVDDIRLTHQVNTPGYAGQVGVTVNMADFGDLRLNLSNRDPNFRQLGEQPTFLGQRNVDMAMTLQLQKLLPASLGIAVPLTVTKVALANDPLYLTRSDISGRDVPGLRKPKNDLTTYSLTVRHTAPLPGVMGAVLNNLAATSTYVSGVDRTEFQDGNARNFTMALDYLVTPESAQTARIPSWVDDALGSLPQILRAGPIESLRAADFRWNPTQFRLTSGVVRGDDRRISYLTPSSAVPDQPATSTASSRLWRNGSVVELRPTTSTSARWEIESLRDFRDYRDSAYTLDGATGRVGVNPGFERERTISSSFAIAPAFSVWFHPRADFGTQYSMLRDPNVRSYTPLPGVIGVDSVLASRDSLSLARILALPRRMTAAQTGSVATLLDLAAAFTAYTRDSTFARRLGHFFAPIDVSYTRSLLSTLDAAPTDAPLSLQFGLAGSNAFRSVSGTDATTAGQTGTLNASGAILLPFGTSFTNRYTRTTTLNWLARPDSTLAHADGAQTRFPDVAFRWGYRPAATSALANVDASVGYARSEASVSLPNLYQDTPPELRRTHLEQFPVSGSLAFAGKSAFSTRAAFSYRRQTDSLPGSIAHSTGNEFSIDAGRAFHVPQSLGLGLKNDLRTRFGVQQSRNSTLVVDPSGTLSSRLQDNGRLAYNLTADANVQDDATLMLQGSYVVTYDNTLNHRFAQTVFSLVYQLKLFGGTR